jgi:hypothetical protein
VRNGAAVAGIALAMATALVTPAAASMNSPTASEPEPVDSYAIAVNMPPPVEG